MSSVNTALNLYRRIIRRFPSGVEFCFAYGSGVKSQIGYEHQPLERNVLDFVLCVADSRIESWHAENINLNPADYSSLKNYGGGFVTKFQRSIPANVYFNTLIPLPDENVTIKYGVVTEADLIRDCNEWVYLYVAGRLQKPVEIVSDSVPDHVANALKRNLTQALSVALLLLPEKFSAYELSYTIAQLSYRGDFRMVFGENPNKVKNIVTPQVDKFLDLYGRDIDRLSKVLHKRNDNVFEQDKSPDNVQMLMEKIPLSYRRQTIRECERDLSNQLAFTVFKSSAVQSIKNIPTAGFIKAIKYSYSKAMKTFSK